MNKVFFSQNSMNSEFKEMFFSCSIQNHTENTMDINEPSVLVNTLRMNLSNGDILGNKMTRTRSNPLYVATGVIYAYSDNYDGSEIIEDLSINVSLNSVGWATDLISTHIIMDSNVRNDTRTTKWNLDEIQKINNSTEPGLFYDVVGRALKEVSYVELIIQVGKW